MSETVPARGDARQRAMDEICPLTDYPSTFVDAVWPIIRRAALDEAIAAAQTQLACGGAVGDATFNDGIDRVLGRLRGLRDQQ